MKQVKKPDGRKKGQPANTPGKKKPSYSNPVVLGAGVIALVAFAVFSPALSAELLGWDDYSYIRDNPLITVFTWENILHVFNFKTVVLGNYHPLTVLSYMIEYQVAGTKPFLYHFDNLLLHLFNIILVARLVWLLTKKNSATLIAAALFALHPMRVESVVWAAERKDVLYTFFFLISLIFYIHFLLRSNRNMQYYLISLLFFVLSVLSKGQAVVLTLVIFLVDYWFSKKIDLTSLLNKIPYLIISIVSGIIAMMAQHSSLTEQRLMAHSVFERIVTAAFNVSAYLYKLVFPFQLSSFYPYPSDGDKLWVYAGALLSVVLIVLVAVLFRKNKTIVFGSLFYLLTLSIVSQILPVGNAIMADRYTYVPYIGLFFIAGVLLDRYITAKPKHAVTVVSAVILVLAVFSIKTYAQAKVWHDNGTLWQNAVDLNPGNGVAYTNLGKHHNEMQEYAVSIGLLKKAVECRNDYYDKFNAWQNLGSAYSRTGNHAEAIRCFSESVALRPGHTEGWFNRGLSNTDLGKYDSAVADFTMIVAKLNPEHKRAWYSRAVAWNKSGQADSAIADYTSAIAVDPGYGEAYVNRGNIRFSRNDYAAALDDYNRAAEIFPGDGTVFLNRSFVLFRMQRYREALDDALRARDLKTDVNPNYIRDLKNRAAQMAR